MSTKSVVRLAALMAQLSILLSGAYASEKEVGKLTVRVIDQAGVNEGEWRVVEQVADRVYREAGVSVTWVHCLWNPGAHNTDCQQRTAPNELTMIVVSEWALRIQDHVFGFSLVPPDGSFGSRGYIFYGRIQTKCSEHHDTNEASLLGAVLAHEIGHLLLGPNAHSRSGIMKPDFKRDDITGANLSGLDFDRRQSETLRNQVARRLEAAHSKGMNPNSYMAQATAPSAAR